MFKKSKLTLSIVLLAIVLLVVFSSATADGGPDGSDRPVTVMTRNLYLGADLTPIFSALQTGEPPLDVAVATVYGQAMASQIPLRAQAIAGEIATAHIEDFALPHQLFHRLPDLLPGRLAIHVMHLV